MDMNERQIWELMAKAVCEFHARDILDLDPSTAELRIHEMRHALEAASKAGFVLMPAKLIADAADYLIGDAEAWEKGSDGNPHEVYLKHCGKLRRDIAQKLRVPFA